MDLHPNKVKTECGWSPIFCPSHSPKCCPLTEVLTYPFREGQRSLDLSAHLVASVIPGLAGPPTAQADMDRLGRKEEESRSVEGNIIRDGRKITATIPQVAILLILGTFQETSQALNFLVIRNSYKDCRNVSSFYRLCQQRQS